MPATLLVTMMVALQSASGLVTIARDSMSQIEDERLAIVQSAAEWEALWRAHSATKPLPKVDFKSRTVIAVFLGTRNTSGYSVEIVGTKQDGKALVVQWSEQRPAADALLAQVLTSPAHIVSIPKFSGPIRFEKAGP